MSTSMIERMARAMSVDPDMDRGNGQPMWTVYEATVREILQAIREPKDEMIDAGYAADRDEDGDMAHEPVSAAMIDEALNGGDS